MDTRNRLSLVIIAAAIIGFSVGGCADPGPDDQAKVAVIVQGGTSADNVVDVVLWAHVDGTEYEFVVNGTAGLTQASFVLEIFLDSSLVHTVNFSLPIADVDAQPGESGSGSTLDTIYPGTTVNNVIIDFSWTGNPVPTGDTNIDLHFIHPPRIIVWSKNPGPGVPAGTTIKILAEVEFFGTNPAVEVQFLDGLGAGTPLETPVSLTFEDPLWTGSIPTAAGAEQLRLTASDDDGTTVSRASFVVAP